MRVSTFFTILILLPIFAIAGNFKLEKLEFEGLDRSVREFAFYNNQLVVLFDDIEDLPPKFLTLPAPSHSPKFARSSLIAQVRLNRSLVIWRLDTGEEVLVVADREQSEEQKQCFQQVHRSGHAINHRGDTLAIFYSDGKVELWHLDGNQSSPFISTKIDHQRYSSGHMVFTDNDDYLVLMTHDFEGRLPSGVVAVFDTQSGLKLWEEYELQNKDIFFSDDQSKILINHRVAGCEERNIISGEVIKKYLFRGNTSSSTSMYGRGGTVLIFAPYDRTVWSFANADTASAVNQWPLKGYIYVQPETVVGVGSSPSHSYDFVPRGSKITFIDPEKSQELFTIEVQNSTNHTNIFSPDESLLMAGNTLIDMNKKKIIHNFASSLGGKFSEDNQFLVTMEQLSYKRIAVWKITPNQ